MKRFGLGPLRTIGGYFNAAVAASRRRMS